MVQRVEWVRSERASDQIVPISQKHEKNDRLSYLLVLFSSVSWVSGFIYPNENKISPYQTNMMKGIIIFWICLVICTRRGYSLSIVNRNQFLFLVFRCLVFIMHDLMTAYVQFKLPLPILHNINNSMAIVIMAIQMIFEGKTLKKQHKWGALFTVLGFLLISNYQYLQPLIRSHYEFKSHFDNYSDLTAFNIFIWSIFYMAIVVLLSFAIYITGWIKMNTYQINLYNSVFLVVVDALIYLLFQEHSSKQTFYFGLGSSGLVFAVGELAFAASILYANNVGVTMLLGSFTVVVSYFWSILRYNQQISVISILGSISIIYAMYKIIIEAQ